MKRLLALILTGIIPSIGLAAGGGLEGYEVGKQADVKGLRRVAQQLVAPPHLPKHDQVAVGGPKIVQVRLTIEEKEIEVEPGVFMWAFTYNGSVPGPLIVAHEGDYIELTLVNPKTSQLPHNIDFHASTGALGGGELTLVNPGEPTTSGSRITTCRETAQENTSATRARFSHSTTTCR